MNAIEITISSSQLRHKYERSTQFTSLPLLAHVHFHIVTQPIGVLFAHHFSALFATDASLPHRCCWCCLFLHLAHLCWLLFLFCGDGGDSIDDDQFARLLGKVVSAFVYAAWLYTPLFTFTRNTNNSNRAQPIVEWPVRLLDTQSNGALFIRLTTPAYDYRLPISKSKRRCTSSKLLCLWYPVTPPFDCVCAHVGLKVTRQHTVPPHLHTISPSCSHIY